MVLVFAGYGEREDEKMLGFASSPPTYGIG
jgi:hypothetical protein